MEPYLPLMGYGPINPFEAPCGVCEAIEYSLATLPPPFRSEHFILLSRYGVTNANVIAPLEHGNPVLDVALKQELVELATMGFGRGRPDFMTWSIVAGWAIKTKTSEHQVISWTLTCPYRSVPQEVADEQAMLMQEAVRWFHDPADIFLGDPGVRSIPDEEVHARVVGWLYAMDKEVSRYTTGMHYFLEFAERPYEDWIDVWLVEYNAWVDERQFFTEHPPMLRYELRDLPFARQRALVERWERVWTDWLAAHPAWAVDNSGFYEAEDVAPGTA